MFFIKKTKTPLPKRPTRQEINKKQMESACKEISEFVKKMISAYPDAIKWCNNVDSIKEIATTPNNHPGDKSQYLLAVDLWALINNRKEDLLFGGIALEDEKINKILQEAIGRGEETR